MLLTSRLLRILLKAMSELFFSASLFVYFAFACTNSSTVFSYEGGHHIDLYLLQGSLRRGGQKKMLNKKAKGMEGHLLLNLRISKHWMMTMMMVAGQVHRRKLIILQN